MNLQRFHIGGSRITHRTRVALAILGGKCVFLTLGAEMDDRTARVQDMSGYGYSSVNQCWCKIYRCFECRRLVSPRLVGAPELLPN
jgi:hypothetical protein